ncbi:MAG: MEDS domain-containing protein [Chitinophagaceae bacterium]|nr:MEDS domain-containing protein [Chitinophagaceae bacterium]
MQESIIDNTLWQQANVQSFWGDIACCDHLVQIYEDEKIFIDSLEGFAGTGILNGDSVIVIGTSCHLNDLESRLNNHGFDLDALRANDQFIPLNAEDLLLKFMVNGWPDETRFNECVKQLFVRARRDGRSVRAFGEMVAILWSKGNRSATAKLEELWNRVCATEKFCLFCAYPKNGFASDDHSAIPHICTAHSKEIGGWAKSSSEIFYKHTA